MGKLQQQSLDYEWIGNKPNYMFPQKIIDKLTGIEWRFVLPQQLEQMKGHLSLKDYTKEQILTCIGNHPAFDDRITNKLNH